MKLQEFVKQTLLDITEGVAAAQEETKLFIAAGIVEGEPQTGAQNVSFEVAVTVSGEGGGGISVMGLGEVKGQVARESISKITFEVPVHLQAPTRKNPRHIENDGPLNPVPKELIEK